MSGQLLASKIVIEEEQPRTRSVTGVPTAVFGAVGVTEMGPIDTETLVSSMEEYTSIFGGYIAAGDLTQAVEGFFRNGGTEAHIVRTVHHSDINDPATKTSQAATLNLLTASAAATAGSVTSAAGPWALVNGATVIAAFELGGNQTFTVSAAAAARETTNSEGTPFALTDGDTLTLKINRGAVQTITFLTSEFADIANATAEEVSAVIAAQIVGAQVSTTSAGTKVTITSDRKGTGSYVEITGGTANAAGKLNFATAEVQGTGNVSDVDAVTAAEMVTIMAGITNGTATNVGGALKLTSATTGGSSTAQVVAGSTADTAMSFDNAVHTGTSGSPVNTLQVDAKYDGTYAHNIKIKIDPPTSGESGKFNFSVVLSGLIVEVFPSLSIGTANAAEDDYCETVINAVTGGSKYVQVVDLAAAVAAPGNAPDGYATTGGLLSAAMSGGDDGLTSLADTDFTGASTDNGRTGLRALDMVQGLALLAIPGQATSAIHNAMITYCEVIRDKQCFAILDPPAATSAKDVVTYFETTAALIGLSEFAAAYWPRIKVLNPSKSVFGSAAQITVPPSGHIAGVYARNDAAKPGGVYTPPAGVENGVIFGCLDFDHSDCLEEAKRDLVFPKRINPLTVFPGVGRHIDGSRTLKGNGNFPSVAERRGAIYIEQSVKDGLQFARHQNNTEELRATVARTVEQFLRTQMTNGAFRSKDPSKAFFVDFGDALNPPSVQFAGQLIGRIGIATNKPAEFLILRFSQDTRALEEELAS